MGLGTCPEQRPNAGKFGENARFLGGYKETARFFFYQRDSERVGFAGEVSELRAKRDQPRVKP